jgi:hypothetical protein
VAKLSCKGSSDSEAIFLYSDGSIPTESEKNMQEYLERLKILAKLQFTAEDRQRPVLPGEIILPDGA